MAVTSVKLQSNPSILGPSSNNFQISRLTTGHDKYIEKLKYKSEYDASCSLQYFYIHKLYIVLCL